MTMKVNRTEVIILIFFLVLNLRVLTWYSGDNLLIRGDFRPPIDGGSYLTHSLSMWNEVDFGLPSVYTPRLLDPRPSASSGRCIPGACGRTDGRGSRRLPSSRDRNRVSGTPASQRRGNVDRLVEAAPPPLEKCADAA